ncbi:hypothetical protein NMY22_g18623 [Coprinellus aureogranulatus]|nr:hypothetical protein NMY22_g18623 [Coprinellus aureogranulatus]
MAPRAGARSQRQTQAQPSQSQAPRGTQRGTQRGGKRQTQEEEAMEEDEEEEAEDEDAPSGSMNVDGDEEVARRANGLVRIALFMEQKRMPLRRDDIVKKVLAPHNRLFKRVFDAAQEKLRDTFGMELVELPTRAGLEKQAVKRIAPASLPLTVAVARMRCFLTMVMTVTATMHNLIMYFSPPRSSFSKSSKMFQYPYSHSTYFTRTTEDAHTSELPPMNSTEDILQIQFMHDRMMTHDEEEKFVVWQRMSRISREIKRGFRSSLQAIVPNHFKKSNRRISVISYRSKDDSRSILS